MRLLLRSRRDFRVPTTPRKVVDRNLVGNNSGNMIFQHAAQRVLSRAGVEISADRSHSGGKLADSINAEYDAWVLPFANAIRPSFAEVLEKYVDTIERLTIPVVILGIGVQLNTAADNPERLEAMEPLVHRLMRGVLRNAPSVGVRGEVTYDYLRALGYSSDEVQVIGCPSLFRNGLDLKLAVPSSLSADSRVALNISPYLPEMGPIATANARRYPKLEYIPQDLATLAMLISRIDPDNADKFAADIPYRVGDPLISSGRTSYFIDPTTWVDYLSGMEFSFGSRIHGNISALLAGTPAFLLAHDSRTLELAKYHEIPYRLLADVPADVDPADLLAQADYSAFHANHPARFQRYLAFLEQHGLRHIFDGSPEAAAGVLAYDQAVDKARSKGPVRLASRSKALMTRKTSQGSEYLRNLRS